MFVLVLVHDQSVFIVFCRLPGPKELSKLELEQDPKEQETSDQMVDRDSPAPPSGAS